MNFYGIRGVSLELTKRYLSGRVQSTKFQSENSDENNIDINIESYEHIRLGVRCRVPPLPRRAPAYAKSIYDSSFAVTGPKLWNILPRSVTCAPSLESFKSRLTSHIMGSYPDLPPVPGYTSPNSNSLLDWSTGGLQQMA